MSTPQELLQALEAEQRLDVRVNGVSLILERCNESVVVLRDAFFYGLDVIGLFQRLSALNELGFFPVILQRRMYVATRCDRTSDSLAHALGVASKLSI